MPLWTAAVVAVAVACALPARASAHAGVPAPAATSFIARLDSVPLGLEAKVVDGDQRLWLRAQPNVTAVVLGFQGEPYLRFTAGGIAANTRSPTYYLNRSRPLVPPHVGAHAAPIWHLVSHARSYSWHEDRLHALAATALAPGSSYVGRWAVPLLVNGKRTQIRGGLWHADPPSLIWFWPIVVLLASLPAVIRLRRSRLDATVMTVLALATLGASTTARLGRELYGRPTVSGWQLAVVAITCLFAVVMAWMYVHPEWRWIGAMLIAVTGMYQGVVVVATLLHGFVLGVLPPVAERITTITALAGGAGLLALLLTSAGVSSEEEERQTAATRTPSLDSPS